MRDVEKDDDDVFGEDSIVNNNELSNLLSGGGTGSSRNVEIPSFTQQNKSCAITTTKQQPFKMVVLSGFIYQMFFFKSRHFSTRFLEVRSKTPVL